MIPILRRVPQQNFDRSNGFEPIDRSILIAVAPDREGPLMSAKSIDDIRQDIKIHIPQSSPRHWLYRFHEYQNVRINEVPDRAPLTSVIDSADLLSGSQIAPRTSDILHRIERVPGTDNQRSTFGISSAPIPVTNTEVLVSPRVLGPTHMLVICPLPSQTDYYERPRRHSSTYAELIEFPINDLIFLANVPSLCRDLKQGSHTRILPPRLPDALPRVFLYVPHLATFRELVVYLHTRNQAKLFRELIPEWARDIMHPLPQISSPAVNTDDFIPTSLCCVPSLRPNFNDDVNKSRLGVVNRPYSTYDEAIATISAQVAEAAAKMDSTEEALKNIFVSLDHLNDNLKYIGHSNKEIRTELQTYRRIILSAISVQAKVVIR